MPKIITIAHQKGGVGKSTLALNLAYAFAENAKVGVLDLDPQGTISRLSELIEPGGPVILKSPITFPESVRGSYPSYDVIFVDTPPYNNDTLPALLSVSDVVIVPTKAGIPDVMAISSTIGFIKQAQVKNKQLKAGIVINMVKPRSGLTESVRDQLEQYDLPVLAEIRDRVSYGRSILSGGVVAGTDQQAANEIIDLTNEILKLL